MRKHRSLMTEEEITAVEQYVRAGMFTIRTTHALSKMAAQGIKADQVDDVLAHGLVIEVSKKKPQNTVKVLLRKTVGSFDVCVVVAVVDGVIVTVWKTNTHDNHDSLDLSIYDWQIDLKEFVSQLN